MKITKNVVVSLVYRVKTDDGILVDESSIAAPLEYIHGHDELISGLENALDGRHIGDKFDIAISAQDAYGDYDENLVQRVPRATFGDADDVEVGMHFLAETNQGPIPVEITDIDGDMVMVDGNHMLAGKNLEFNVEVIGLRKATPQEISHGHVHGNDSCCNEDDDECDCH